MNDFPHGGEDTTLAPVIPLFRARGRSASSAARGEIHPNLQAGDDEPSDDQPSDDGSGDNGSSDNEFGDEASADDVAAQIEAAHSMLLRRLRARQLSIREARAVIAQHHLPSPETEELVSTLERLGYLDDARLAEQLVHAGSDRRGQGRHAISQTLAKRGVPRDAADQALQALPDDDLERALEFARSKARSTASLDREVALRRLVGQLSRRGYPSSVAMTAARTALDESGAVRGGGAARSGPRFS